jgi:mannosyltransferase OCH1-like enzyme
MIPKIIHQTGPTNKENWHPLWIPCAKSWKTHFSDFDYMFWDDHGIDDLVKTEYPVYWQLYQDFPIHIMKIDFARLCLMHKFGGIYADLDVFCYQNFYSELSEPIYILENPMGNDPIENSIMCSEPGHEFWIECMDLTKNRYEYVKNKYPDMFDHIQDIASNEQFGLLFRPYFVFYITGTNHLSSAARMTSYTISTLPGILYNNNDMSYHSDYRTKHIHTGIWGKESIEIYKTDRTHQTSLRGVPINKFDFYTDYTNGNFLTVNILDLYKNETDELISPNLEYSFC